jgi:hypothetical protein
LRRQGGGNAAGALRRTRLLLAAIGIYSVLSYNAKRRVREIGIRMALGTQVRDVLRIIVIEGMRRHSAIISLP